MDIVWHGHACFRLRGREASIVTDPYDRSTGYPALKLTADVLTISNHTSQHANTAAVSAAGDKLRQVDGPGEYEVAGSLIEGVVTYRDKQKGKERGKNTAYMIHLDDLSVCHLGALAHTLSSSQIESLKDADVLLVPVGGGDVLDAAAAAEVVSQLEPRIVIPMYYGTPALQLDAVDRFCAEMAVTEIVPQARLVVTRSSLPEETRLIVLAAPEPKR
ncbi:MAG: MBL fold metallo-hydrolase [Chloroflexi bacterium]|nr:MBL fold metallo-hydrolase [Chloroflexota bacterium]